MNTYTRVSKMQKLLMIKQIVQYSNHCSCSILPHFSESIFHEILFPRYRSMAYAIDKMLLSN
jgi:hypothetical protein